MKTLKSILLVIILLSFQVNAQINKQDKSVKSSTAEKRETIFDRKIHIQDSVIWEIPKVTRWCDKLKLDKKYIDIGGCKLYVEEQGKGVPIVLLHGGPGSTHHEFHPIFDKASKYARVIYYDQRGCGLSDYKPEDGYTITQAANDLDKLREKLGIEKWIVLGHSYGGLLAQYYTTLFPERVKGLVIVCGSTGLYYEGAARKRELDFISKEENTAMFKFFREIDEKAQKEKWPEEKKTKIEIYNAFMNGDWKRQSYYSPNMDKIAQIALYNGQNDLKNEFNRNMSYSLSEINLKGKFNECPIPTLIIESVWDLSWIENKANMLAKNHPNADMVVFTKSGHDPYNDEPDRFFGSLKDFTSKLKPVPDNLLSAYKTYLHKTIDMFDDPLLASPISEAEAKELERYKSTFNKIKGGEKYFDLSSPLNCMLSLYSACRESDFVRINKIKVTYKIKPENIKWIIERLELIPWRVPAPPSNPKPGQFWPIYVKGKETNRWAQTFIYQYWKGQWVEWGNIPKPFSDWREFELWSQNEFLIYKLQNPDNN